MGGYGAYRSGSSTSTATTPEPSSWLQTLGNWFKPQVNEKTGIAGDSIAQSLLGTGSGLANTWMAWQGLGMAKDQFKHQVALDKTNVNNQVSMIEMGREDQLRSRAAAQGQSYQSLAALDDRHKLQGFT